MYSIAALQAIVQEALTRKDFLKEPKTLYEPIQYFLNIGGKRLRPVLTLLAANMYRPDIEDSLSAALAIEIFHNFTLMHDDIMDEAPLRRGQATVHKKWNTNTAILSGDAMLISAYQLLAESPAQQLPEILHVFNKMAQEVCEGQQLDMDFEEATAVSEEAYIQMIRLKTSVLLGAALEIGAILGGAQRYDQGLIYDFGVNMGIAFQLQDDLLDVYGDPLKFGKQVGGDIMENKKTFLLINALQLAQDKDAEVLHYWLNTKQFDAEEKVNTIRSIYDKLGVRVLAEKAKAHFAEAAFTSLNKVELSAEKKQLLIQFAQNLLIRES